MGVLLYLLISGDVLYCGLFVVAVGAAVERWSRTLGVGLVWAGLVLAVASAVPLHPLAYATLLLCGIGWHIARGRAIHLQKGTTAALLLVVVAVFRVALSARGIGDLTLPRDRAIYVLGDSLSAGLGASKSGTWPQLLSSERKLSVSNLATPGATLVDGALQARVIPKGPVTVLIELGGNDLLSGTPRARSAADLRSLLVAVVAGERRVLMFELPQLPLQNEYGRIRREACNQYGVALLPRSILAGAIALPGHASDGLHLSARGHRWVARHVSEVWR